MQLQKYNIKQKKKVCIVKGVIQSVAVELVQYVEAAFMSEERMSLFALPGVNFLPRH